MVSYWKDAKEWRVKANWAASSPVENNGTSTEFTERWYALKKMWFTLCVKQGVK